MKKTVLMVAAVTVGAFGALAQNAAADPNPLLCKLEQMGVYHSPIGSACHDNPWDPEG